MKTFRIIVPVTGTTPFYIEAATAKEALAQIKAGRSYIQQTPRYLEDGNFDETIDFQFHKAKIDKDFIPLEKKEEK